MLKYLAIFVVILGVAVYIAREDERTAQEAAQKPANSFCDQGHRFPLSTRG
jgi:hypothetical protein